VVWMVAAPMIGKLDGGPCGKVVAATLLDFCFVMDTKTIVLLAVALVMVVAALWVGPAGMVFLGCAMMVAMVVVMDGENMRAAAMYGLIFRCAAIVAGGAVGCLLPSLLLSPVRLRHLYHERQWLYRRVCWECGDCLFGWVPLLLTLR